MSKPQELRSGRFLIRESSGDTLVFEIHDGDVGSEMGELDKYGFFCTYSLEGEHLPKYIASELRELADLIDRWNAGAVSYTHLTLPTILRV